MDIPGDAKPAKTVLAETVPQAQPTSPTSADADAARRELQAIISRPPSPPPPVSPPVPPSSEQPPVQWAVPGPTATTQPGFRSSHHQQPAAAAPVVPLPPEQAPVQWAVPTLSSDERWGAGAVGNPPHTPSVPQQLSPEPAPAAQWAVPGLKPDYRGRTKERAPESAQLEEPTEPESLLEQSDRLSKQQLSKEQAKAESASLSKHAARAFKFGDYAAAEKSYGAALKLTPGKYTLWGNRSACRLLASNWNGVRHPGLKLNMPA